MDMTVYGMLLSKILKMSKGEKGDPGESATVAVGNVTNGPLAVTNTGTSSNVVLDFSIPIPSGVTISDDGNGNVTIENNGGD